MREILFRGKCDQTNHMHANCGEWIEGSHCLDVGERHFISRVEYLDPIGYVLEDYLVDLKTIGQYTGLTDKNGKKIFEGDLVRFVNPETGELSEYVYEVFWDDDYVGFRMFFHKTGYREAFDGVPHWYVVVGNIHDNPELVNPELVKGD